jgi:hypothetical protein
MQSVIELLAVGYWLLAFGSAGNIAASHKNYGRRHFVRTAVFK